MCQQFHAVLDKTFQASARLVKIKFNKHSHPLWFESFFFNIYALKINILYYKCDKYYNCFKIHHTLVKTPLKKSYRSFILDTQKI